MNRHVTTVQQFLAEHAHFVRLSGPLAGNANARILHALLIGLVAWSVLYGLVFLPLIAPRPAANAALLGAQIIAFGASLMVLRLGDLRKASLIYLSGVWVTATAIIVLNGGIQSPGLVYYVAIPISAAWLLGSRAAALSSIVCVFAAFLMAAVAAAGIRLPRYLPGVPFGIWIVILQSTIIAAVPVMVVLRALNESLALAQVWIGELRKAHDALRRERDMVSRLMETSPVGIVALDIEGRITFANSTAERIFGVTRDELTRRTYNDLAWGTTTFEGDPFPDDELPFRQVQSQGGGLRDVRLAVVRPDGRRVLLSINAAPVPSVSGRFDGMVASIEDVTERARVEGELRKYREHLEELVRVRTDELIVARDQAMAASQAKSVLLANVSHELRTPLHAILGFSRLISETMDISSDHVEKLRAITRSGEHLLDVINDVLDMAKTEAGPVAARKARTDVEELVRGVTEMIRIRAGEKGLELLVEQSPGFPRFVMTDAAKLRQILLNLLSNSVKYTERGRVTLRMDADPDDGARLRFEVSDTGLGISKEDQERIFSPFVQVGAPGAGGTGLGLAVTKQYVQLMGGAIEVESAPGHGSRFVVRLPVEIAEGGAVSEAPPEREHVIGLAPSQPEWRILIVEDERDNRLLLQEVLTRAGFVVRSAENGAAAVEMFPSWQPHFVWMDWGLPVMGGQMATEHIRRMQGGREVRIAAMTASVFPEERARILAAGVDDLLLKPFRTQEVFDCMARLLGVQYVYEKRALHGEITEESALTPDAVRALPKPLREELADALISLDVMRVRQVIHRASEVNGVVGALLSQYANRIAFTPILKALRATAGQGGKGAV